MRHHTLTKNNKRGLWSVLWRVLLFGPIIMPLGFFLFVGVVAIVLAPFAYAAMLMLSGNVLWGGLLAALWFTVVWFARPLLRRLVDGIEYAAM